MISHVRFKKCSNPEASSLDFFDPLPTWERLPAITREIKFWNNALRYGNALRERIVPESTGDRLVSSIVMCLNEFELGLPPVRITAENAQTVEDYSRLQVSAFISASRLTGAMLKAATAPETQHDFNRVVGLLVPLPELGEAGLTDDSALSVALPTFQVGNALADALLPAMEGDSWHVTDQNNMQDNLYVNRICPARPAHTLEQLTALMGEPFNPEAWSTLTPFVAKP